MIWINNTTSHSCEYTSLPRANITQSLWHPSTANTPKTIIRINRLFLVRSNNCVPGKDSICESDIITVMHLLPSVSRVSWKSLLPSTIAVAGRLAVSFRLAQSAPCPAPNRRRPDFASLNVPQIPLDKYTALFSDSNWDLFRHRDCPNCWRLPFGLGRRLGDHPDPSGCQFSWSQNTVRRRRLRRNQRTPTTSTVRIWNGCCQPLGDGRFSVADARHFALKRTSPLAMVWRDEGALVGPLEKAFWKRWMPLLLICQNAEFLLYRGVLSVATQSSSISGTEERYAVDMWYSMEPRDMGVDEEMRVGMLNQ